MRERVSVDSLFWVCTGPLSADAIMALPHFPHVHLLRHADGTRSVWHDVSGDEHAVAADATLHFDSDCMVVFARLGLDPSVSLLWLAFLV